jgi:hypothetical protein
MTARGLMEYIFQFEPIWLEYSTPETSSQNQRSDVPACSTLIHPENLIPRFAEIRSVARSHFNLIWCLTNFAEAEVFY